MLMSQKEKISNGMYSTELICLNGCLSSTWSKMANFNSTLWSTVEPFALKAEGKKNKKNQQITQETTPGNPPKSCISCWVAQLGRIAWQIMLNSWIIPVSQTSSGCREAHKSVEVAHSSRLPRCRDCCERLGYRHICHCEWTNSEFNNQLWRLCHPEPKDTGDDSGVPQKNIHGKEIRKKEKKFGKKTKQLKKKQKKKQNLYSYANKELKSCDHFVVGSVILLKPT